MIDFLLMNQIVGRKHSHYQNILIVEGFRHHRAVCRIHPRTLFADQQDASSLNMSSLVWVLQALIEQAFLMLCKEYHLFIWTHQYRKQMANCSADSCGCLLSHDLHAVQSTAINWFPTSLAGSHSCYSFDSCIDCCIKSHLPSTVVNFSKKIRKRRGRIWNTILKIGDYRFICR